MSLTQARFANGQMGVEVRDDDTDPWSRHNFTRLYRRMRNNRWERLTGSVIWIRPNDMYMNPVNLQGAQTAELFTSINPGNVTVHQVLIRSMSGMWNIVVRPPRQLNVQAFMQDIYARRRVRGLQLAQSCAIGVAVFTGIAMAGGFGPAAGAFGLGSAAGTCTSALISGLTGAITTFIHQNYLAMATAARSGNVAHFYRDRRYDFETILMNTLIGGAAGAATSFIPGPRNGVNSLRDLVRLLGERMLNAFAGVAQNIVTHMIPANNARLTPTQIQQNINSALLLDIAIRCGG